MGAKAEVWSLNFLWEVQSIKEGHDSPVSLQWLFTFYQMTKLNFRLVHIESICRCQISLTLNLFSEG